MLIEVSIYNKSMNKTERNKILVILPLLIVLAIASIWYRDKPDTDTPLEMDVTLSDSEYYIKDGENIYFRFMYDPLVKVEGADSQTFVPLKEPGYIAFDKNHVYITGYVVPDADPHTFEAMGYRSYYKDKNFVYFEHQIEPQSIRTTLLKLSDLNAQKVRRVSDYTIADDRSVYYGGKKIEVIDPATFKLIKEPYFVDSKATYFFDNRSYKTLAPVVISNTILKKIFTNDSIIGGYINIGDTMFFGTSTITGADASTFNVLLDNCTFTSSCLYAIDMNNVYYNGKIILGADSKTFKLSGNIDELRGLGKTDDGIRQSAFATDSNHAYYEGEVIVGADPKTFMPIISGAYYFEYAKDKDRVYFRSYPVVGADLETFKPSEGQQPYEGCGAGRYATDKNNVFYKEKLIPGADVKTFKIKIGGGGNYAEDANYFYNNGIHADPKIFKECEYG
mgnify:CR=1 FL=1